MIYYFSATGNCKYVAERIAKEFCDVANSIEQSDGSVTLKDEEMLGFVMPVNWWELPILTREFLQKLSVSGKKPAYSYIVTTYGTTPGCTYADAKKILSEKGIELNAGFSIKMPDNWTPMFDLSNSDKVRKLNEDAEHYIDDVLKRIKERKLGNQMQNPVPYFVRLVTKQLLDQARKTKKFYVEESCIGCGLCADRCPVKAIEIKNKKPVWVKEQCALCLRCLHHCPKFSIQYGNGKTKQHGQYRNPHTTV